jgi:hypothetical protein
MLDIIHAVCPESVAIDDILVKEVANEKARAVSMEWARESRVRAISCGKVALVGGGRSSVDVSPENWVQG